MKPESCDVGLKEWSGICRALSSGRQTIILRKGGISEVSGPGNFVPEHPAFWLFPTHLHESDQGLREDVPAESPSLLCPPGKVPISTIAAAFPLGRIDDERQLNLLREFHVWTDETVWRRFHYRTPGLWVLALRTYSRDTPFILDMTPEREGCKSWVPLGRSLSTSGSKPAIDDDAWLNVERKLRSLLNPIEM